MLPQCLLPDASPCLAVADVDGDGARGTPGTRPSCVTMPSPRARTPVSSRWWPVSIPPTCSSFCRHGVCCPSYARDGGVRGGPWVVALHVRRQLLKKRIRRATVGKTAVGNTGRRHRCCMEKRMGEAVDHEASMGTMGAASSLGSGVASGGRIGDLVRIGAQGRTDVIVWQHRSLRREVAGAAATGGGV